MTGLVSLSAETAPPQVHQYYLLVWTLIALVGAWVLGLLAVQLLRLLRTRRYQDDRRRPLRSIPGPDPWEEAGRRLEPPPPDPIPPHDS